MKWSSFCFSFFLLICCKLAFIRAFAAKKASGKTRVASSGKGFGAPPPTWEEVASNFRTRFPRNSDHEPCPCQSGCLYKDCCAPFHRGIRHPENPIDVLRSRYTAFAWRDIKYIVESTHPNCADWREDKVAWVKDLNKSGMFDNHDFLGLDIGEEEMSSDSEGHVEFKVTMSGKEGSSFEGTERVVVERSQFLKHAERHWLYASGEIKNV